METITIIKTIGWIMLIGLFFALGITNGIFTNLQNYITELNQNFFSNMDARILFLITFVIFAIIFAFILSFLD